MIQPALPRPALTSLTPPRCWCSLHWCPGAWCLVPGAWCLVPYCLVPGAWLLPLLSQFGVKIRFSHGKPASLTVAREGRGASGPAQLGALQATSGGPVRPSPGPAESSGPAPAQPPPGPAPDRHQSAAPRQNKERDYTFLVFKQLSGQSSTLFLFPIGDKIIQTMLVVTTAAVQHFRT